VITLPGIPVYTVSKGDVCALVIEAVQVGEVTGLVPPGSLKTYGTVAVKGVVVSIFGAKRHATMI